MNVPRCNSVLHGFECFIRRDTQRLGKKDKWSSTTGSRTGAPDGQNDEGGSEPWPSDVQQDRLMSRAQTKRREASVWPSATSENTVEIPNSKGAFARSWELEKLKTMEFAELV